MNIYEAIKKYVIGGYSEVDAISKVAQDIILLKIGNSRYSKNITVKGGVVIHNISKDRRRATRDMDIDFIRCSLEDEAINKFIDALNDIDDGIKIEVKHDIEPLHHQDYDGKRVHIRLTDNNNYSIKSKLDIGVHKYFDIEQDEYYFDLSIIDKSVSLLINSKEQIIVEKLKSLLKFGITSTRYKDISDFYYLINHECIDSKKLIKYINILIFQDNKMQENTLQDIYIRLVSILNNRNFQSRITTSNNNWLGIPIKEVINNVLEYFKQIMV